MESSDNADVHAASNTDVTKTAPSMNIAHVEYLRLYLAEGTYPANVSRNDKRNIRRTAKHFVLSEDCELLRKGCKDKTFKVSTA
jgi:hypothetical protein